MARSFEALSKLGKLLTSLNSSLSSRPIPTAERNLTKDRRARAREAQDEMKQCSQQVPRARAIFRESARKNVRAISVRAAAAAALFVGL